MQEKHAADLSGEDIAHGLIHVHQLTCSAALSINGGTVCQAQPMQLLPHGCQAICKLRHIGAVQTVYAVGAQHAVLHLYLPPLQPNTCLAKRILFVHTFLPLYVLVPTGIHTNVCSVDMSYSCNNYS